jgi:hypothetical protein
MLLNLLTFINSENDLRQEDAEQLLGLTILFQLSRITFYLRLSVVFFNILTDSKRVSRAVSLSADCVTIPATYIRFIPLSYLCLFFH